MTRLLLIPYLRLYVSLHGLHFPPKATSGLQNLQSNVPISSWPPLERFARNDHWESENPKYLARGLESSSIVVFFSLMTRNCSQSSPGWAPLEVKAPRVGNASWSPDALTFQKWRFYFIFLSGAEAEKGTEVMYFLLAAFQKQLEEKNRESSFTFYISWLVHEQEKILTWNNKEESVPSHLMDIRNSSLGVGARLCSCHSIQITMMLNKCFPGDRISKLFSRGSGGKS